MEKLTVANLFKKFPLLLWKAKPYYGTYNTQSVDTIPKQFSPICIFKICVLKIYSYSHPVYVQVFKIVFFFKISNQNIVN